MRALAPTLKLGSSRQVCAECGGRVATPGEITGWVGRVCQCPPAKPKTLEDRVAELERRMDIFSRGPLTY